MIWQNLTRFPAIIEEVHEESEVLEEQLTLGLHQVSPVGFLWLQWEALKEFGHCVHASLVQISGYGRDVGNSHRGWYLISVIQVRSLTQIVFVHSGSFNRGFSLSKKYFTLNSLIKVLILWQKTYQNLQRYSLFLVVLLEWIQDFYLWYFYFSGTIE